MPVKLFGEGNYAITDIQKVNVTTQFLGLDPETRGCHLNTELEGCETKTYLEKLKEECGCVPNNIRRFFPEEEVIFFFLEFPVFHPLSIFSLRPVPWKIWSVWEESG